LPVHLLCHSIRLCRFNETGWLNLCLTSGPGCSMNNAISICAMLVISDELFSPFCAILPVFVAHRKIGRSQVVPCYRTWLLDVKMCSLICAILRTLRLVFPARGTHFLLARFILPLSLLFTFVLLLLCYSTCLCRSSKNRHNALCSTTLDVASES
jgi:hypothetical protein